MIADPFIRHALVVKVTDGDTFVAKVDLGFRLYAEMPLRVFGINSPERGEPGYKEATAYLSQLLMRCGEAGVMCRTYKPTVAGGTDKYGRYLAEVFSAVDGTDIGQAMIDGGYAKAYFGGTR